MTVVDIWDGAPAAPDGSGGAAGLLLPEGMADYDCLPEAK